MKLKLIYARRSVGQFVYISGSYLEPMTRFLFFVWRLRVYWCRKPSLTRDVSVIYLYNCLLAMPEQSLVVQSPTELMTVFYSHLRLPQLGGPGPCIYLPQEQSGPVISPRTGFHFVASYDSQGYGTLFSLLYVLWLLPSPTGLLLLLYHGYTFR
jgi:hypothetical protein